MQRWPSQYLDRERQALRISRGVELILHIREGRARQLVGHLELMLLLRRCKYYRAFANDPNPRVAHIGHIEDRSGMLQARHHEGGRPRHLTQVGLMCVEKIIIDASA
jgi:hypothetical protein